MTDSQTIRVRDIGGLVHFSSRYSPWVLSGLGDGSLVEVDEHGDPIPQEEVDGGGTENVGPSGRVDARTGERESRNRKPDAGAGDGGVDEGVSEPASGS